MYWEGRERSDRIGKEGSGAIVSGREEVLVLGIGKGRGAPDWEGRERSDRIGKGRGAPEAAISLQKEVQIASALLQCDSIVTEESIDLS